MGGSVGRERRAGGARWLLWALLALGWFATIQLRPLLDPDEGRYAQIPREMLASGDFVTPRFNDLKYFEKPPLQYWATAVMYAIFGFSEWTSRAWSVGLAFACLALVFAWVQRLYGAEDLGFQSETVLAREPDVVRVALAQFGSGLRRLAIGGRAHDCRDRPEPPRWDGEAASVDRGPALANGAPA